MDIKGLAQVLNLDPLRLIEGQGALNAVLSRLSGTELEALLAGRTQDGLLLELLGGRTVVAGGDLPFPDGTQLLFRAVPAPDTGGLRLQLLEATPPPPSPALVPLEQGEATALLQRVLGAEILPEVLAPLRALFAQAAEAPASSQAPPQPSPQPPPPTLPEAPALRTEVPSARMPAATSTPQTPTTTAPPPPDLPLLKAWVAEALPPPPAPTSLAHAPPPSAPPGPSLPAALPTAPALAADLVARGVPPAEAEAWSAFLVDPEATPPSLPSPLIPPRLDTPLVGATPIAVSALPTTSTPAPEPLSEWHQALRLLFAAPEAEAPAATPRPMNAVLDELRRAQVPEQVVQRLLPLLALARSTPAGGAIEQLLRALLPQSAAPPLPKVAIPTPPPQVFASPASAKQAQAPAHAFEAPEAWEGWLQRSTSALADPKLSPREAPFHALQAREGTALFELPLPLPGLRGPVELWVERDREGGGGDEAPARMLLALDLEGMGQVRLGVERTGGRIRADLWVEEDRRAAVAKALGAELGDPPPYPVRVLGFHGPQLGLRQVAGAGAFGALG